MEPGSSKVIILTGAYDDQYLLTRRDNPVICTSAGKRIILYQAIERAAGRPVLLLSPQPRGRGQAEFLAETSNHFGTLPQLFSKASGIRKVRFVLDFLHYARHVARHTRSGDTLIIDNYELIYVLAIYYGILLGRRNRVLLEYEDGKHLIDKGIWKCISGLAEWLGRPLVRGAILATPTLGERLPAGIPKVTVPGILREDITPRLMPSPGQPVRFLYSGSLDPERGIPLLMNYLEAGDFPEGAVFHITGQGHFVEQLQSLQDRHPEVIRFHGSVSQEELTAIRHQCHYGLNLQSATHPISSVTYPSKTFDYLNSGLRVISTRAAGVDAVLGDTAIYIEEETSASLGRAIQSAMNQSREATVSSIIHGMESFTYQGTIARLRILLDAR